jgi:transcription initiation factor TFIIIB Brf1 subunit/transcription initiation factor TFIIB
VRPLTTFKRPKKNKWLYSASELTTSTPSVREGIPSKVEMIQRSKGVNFIVQVGSHLKLPQMTVNAASTFLHRFYLRYSLNRYHYYDMGATCLFLATKVEETKRRLRDVAIACTKIALKNPKLVVDEQSKDYWRWRDNILLNEDILLEAICFDMSLDSPYELLSAYVERLGVNHLSSLKRCAWAFVNDSARTTLSIMFPTKVIAAAAIYWASKYTKNEIPISAWWEDLDIDKADIKESCNIMADLYESLLGSYQADVTQKYIRVTSPQDLQSLKRPNDEDVSDVPNKVPKTE